jgi:MFS family permease
LKSALTDVPSNWALTHVSPRWWLPMLMFGWGAVLCGMAFISNWQAVAFMRFLLGAFEGGVLPGIVFSISCFYTKTELHKRIAVAYGLGIIASAFAGILSYGLGQLDGVRGMNGWRWIFSVSCDAPDLSCSHKPIGGVARYADMWY